ncbi:hypothetical protein B0H10DRAFT_50599 [Mycena sp. CBHHK59/15]|nr:hypothetical protein B0H10DRAFT_50599 [Mycena sp. CBHHK59/15]
MSASLALRPTLLLSFFVSVLSLTSPKAKPSHVSLYRDCSAADLACIAILTALKGYYLAATSPSSRFSRSSSPTTASAGLSVPPSTSSRARSCGPLSGASSPPLSLQSTRMMRPQLHLLLTVSAHYAHLMRSSLAAQSCPQRIPRRPPSPRPASSTPRSTSPPASARVPPGSAAPTPTPSADAGPREPFRRRRIQRQARVDLVRRSSFPLLSCVSLLLLVLLCLVVVS